MGFEKFGVVSYTKQTKVVDFVRFLEQGKVVGTKCKECERIFFPPKIDCPKCLKSDTGWFEICGNGKLMTYTKVNYGPVGFEGKAPYILGVAQFDEGIQIMAALSKEIKEGDITVGMEVKVTPIVLGEEKLSYEFKMAC